MRRVGRCSVLLEQLHGDETIAYATHVPIYSRLQMVELEKSLSCL